MEWFRFYDEVLDDPKVQRLPADEFKSNLLAAMRGERNEWSRWIRKGSDRPVAHEWRRLRTVVFQRDNYTCHYCGKRGVRLECDHVVPVSKGGSNCLSNLVTSCFTCNRSKRDKLVEEWVR